MDQYSGDYNYHYEEDDYREEYCTICGNPHSVQYCDLFEPSPLYTYYEEPRYEPSTSYTSYEEPRYEPSPSYSYFDEPRYKPSYSYFEEPRYEPSPSYAYYEDPWREQPTSYKYCEQPSYEPYPSYIYNVEQWYEPSTSYEYYEEPRIELPNSSFEDTYSTQFDEPPTISPVAEKIIEHLKTIERYIKEARAREEESLAREESTCNKEVTLEEVKMEEKVSEKPTHELNNEKGKSDNVKIQEESNFQEINLLSPSFENHCLIPTHAKFLKELNTNTKIDEMVSIKLTNDQTTQIKDDPFESNITPVPCFFFKIPLLVILQLIKIFVLI
ncbi:hypothetical protein HanIR_Chr02g0068261 [Helianthus annuus]|nr:hypothetical protein HanIR_Chr02g0068261 [Helianthus annuus]